MIIVQRRLYIRDVVCKIGFKSIFFFKRNAIFITCLSLISHIVTWSDSYVMVDAWRIKLDWFLSNTRSVSASKHLSITFSHFLSGRLIFSIYIRISSSICSFPSLLIYNLPHFPLSLSLGHSFSIFMHTDRSSSPSQFLFQCPISIPFASKSIDLNKYSFLSVSRSYWYISLFLLFLCIYSLWVFSHSFLPFSPPIHPSTLLRHAPHSSTPP